MFYSWLGLDSKLMYSAHKAAGGMTSIYRQIGIGCERLFRAILMDVCQYDDPSYATWSYNAKTKSGGDKILSLDGRLYLDKINNEALVDRIEKWISSYCKELGVFSNPANGVVFEVRQGYKSKDSKRQNADIDNATVAWASGYFPVFAIFSSQIDGDIVMRYRNSRCGTLIGVNDGGNQFSIFQFFNEIIGYDLNSFFERNHGVISGEISEVLNLLLNAE